MNLDADQQRAASAIRHGSGVVLLFGPGGSGKTFVVRETLKEVSTRCIYSAVATTTARRFGGADAINTMELYHVVKQYCADQTHRLLETNPTCARIFGPMGLLRLGQRFFIAIDEAGMVSGNHLKQLVDGLWQAAKKHPDPLQRFNRITWVLLGDPERQLPNISGLPLLKSPVFYDHESKFHRRVGCFCLCGAHRFSPDSRALMAEIEEAFKVNDTELLSSIVANRKRAYRKFPQEKLTSVRHFVATRVEAERYICTAADALFGEDVTVLSTKPSDEMSEDLRFRSEFTAANYIFPDDGRVKVLLQATVAGQQIKATACDNPEDQTCVPNRTVFEVDATAITDLPSEYPVRKSAATLSVFYDDTDRTMPMFHFDKMGNARPIFRQVGWVDVTGRTITSVELLYNAQGAQCPGETIVIGSADCRAPITGTTVYVALTRTDDPANVLIHPELPVTFTAEDWQRRLATSSLIQQFVQGAHLKSEQRSGPQPKRRRLSCQLPQICG